MINKAIKTIFFDYDGTLHNSLKIYKSAFLTSYAWLVDLGYKPPKKWTDKEISAFLGQNPKEMWASFGKGIPQHVQDQASKMIGDTMASLIKEGKAELYPNSLETLKTLQDRGYTLIFISNCKNKYMQAHNTAFNLDSYFKKLITSEMYDYISKSAIVKQVMAEYDESMAIIGDRHHDIDAGKDNNLFTVGCNYGFGEDIELEKADAIINKIDDLLTIFH